MRDDWQGSGDVFDSTDGLTWHRIGHHDRLQSYGLTVGSNGILITLSVEKGGPTDEVDAAVAFLAAK